jgi:hypothetical protein
MATSGISFEPRVGKSTLHSDSAVGISILASVMPPSLALRLESRGPRNSALAAIRYFHRAAGLEAPTSDEKVKAVLSGIRRTIGAAAVRKKAATSDSGSAWSAARVPRCANFATAPSCCLGSLAHSDDPSSWPLT